jgi:endonuclease YncB( thermonuclease family)
MRNLILPLMILSILALSGCGGSSIEEAEDPTQTPYIIVVSPTPPQTTETAFSTSQTEDQEKQLARVVEVVDGDTIRVVIDGVEYSVRYIGIDAPEVQNNEWYGAESRDANADLVSGKDVLLEKDVSDTDQYGRLLRYVYLVDGTFVNAELVLLGVAESKAYPPDTKYYDYLETLEQEAKSENLGQWQVKPTVELTSNTSDAANVQIIDVDKRAEYVDIQNIGYQSVSIEKWTLRSDKGDQDCLLSGILEPGEILRVWALISDGEKEGFNCRFSNYIWNNSELDPAVLFDASFTEIDQYP